MVTQRLSKRRMHDEGRSRLLEAALDVLSRKGFEGTSVEDICQAAGYSKGGFYFHFRGKEELLLHLVEEAIRTDRDSGHGFGEGWSPALLTEIWAQAPRKPRIRELLTEYYRNRREELRLDRKRRKGSAVSPSAMADLILVLEVGLHIQSLVSSSDRHRYQAQRVLETLLPASSAGGPAVDGREVSRTSTG